MQNKGQIAYNDQRSQQKETHQQSSLNTSANSIQVCSIYSPVQTNISKNRFQCKVYLNVSFHPFSWSKNDLTKKHARDMALAREASSYFIHIRWITKDRKRHTKLFGRNHNGNELNTAEYVFSRYNGRRLDNHLKNFFFMTFHHKINKEKQTNNVEIHRKAHSKYRISSTQFFRRGYTRAVALQ